MNRYEVIAEGFEENTGLQKILNGLRAAREQEFKKPLSDRHKLLYELGLEVAGPLLCGFTLEVLEHCERLDIDRLYCLSRDGQLMLKVMKVLSCSGEHQPDIHYCLTSRSALRRPEAHLSGSEAPSWLVDGSGDLTVEMVFERLDMDIDQWRPWLQKNGWKQKPTDAPLNPADRKLIKSWFSSPEFTGGFSEICKHQYGAAIEYFDEIEMLKDGNTAICDVGWKGSLQASIESIVKSVNTNVTLTGFYLGLLEHVDRGCDCRKYAYLKKGSPEQSLVGTPGFTEVLEILLPANHPGVLRYGCEETAPCVEFAEKSQAMGYDNSYSIYVAGVMTCAQIVANCICVESGCSDSVQGLRHQSIRNISSLVNNPTIEEANLLGKMHHSIEPMHNNGAEIIPEITIKSMIRMATSRGTRWVFWHAGILKINPGMAGKMFVALCKLRKLLAKLRDGSSLKE